MLRVKSLFVFLTISLIIVGCQDNNLQKQENNLDLTDIITSIEVYDWDSETFKTTIKNKEFIQELVRELDTAKTHSTELIDWALPDYKLYFKHDNDVLYEIGYCKDIQNFGNGAVGRYWVFDKLFEVSTQLPAE